MRHTLKATIMAAALLAVPAYAAEPPPKPCCQATLDVPPEVWQAMVQWANNSLPTKYGVALIQQATKQVQPQIDALNKTQPQKAAGK